MKTLNFNQLTRRQQQVLDQVAVNNDAGHPPKTLQSLEKAGFIVGEDATLPGFPPVKVRRYSMPIAVHIQWTQWCMGRE